MKYSQKLIALLLILTCLSLSPTYIFAGGNVLTVDEAISLAKENGIEILKADKTIYEKKIALTQARKAVNYGYKKLRRLFEKAPTFDKALGLATKIETAEKDLKVAKSARIAAERKIKYDVINLYMKAFYAQENEKNALKVLNEEQSKLKLGQIKLSQNLITADSFQAQSDLVDEKTKAYEKAKADFVSAKSKLRDKIGKDVSNRTFTYTYLKGALPQDKLIQMIKTMYQVSHDLYALDENIKLNTHIVNVNSKLYSSKFGSSKMTGMKNLINKGIGNITDKELMVGYDNLVNALIAKWGDDWKSYYKIDLVLISFKIPKLFRTGEFDGVRYLEDSRYSLSIAISQTQQIIMEERTTRSTLTEVVINLFGAVNSKTMEYEALKSDFDKLAREYDMNQNKYKLGLVEADLLIEQKMELDSIQEQIAVKIYEINEKIIELDGMTDGAYSRLLKVESASNPNLKASPFLSPSAKELMKEAETELGNADVKGIWSLAPVAEGMTQMLTFNMSGSKASTIAFYRLFNEDGVAISENVAIAEGFTHLSIIFADRTNLVVNFYDANEELLYKATFDGYGEFGSLKISE